jgi:predicted TIM-barrel fold metal-dependent hydrolase
VYHGTKVLDVHGHVSVASGANNYITTLLSSNSLTRSPLFGGRGSGPSEDQYRAAAARHVAYMDERGIDVQVIGPRPFLMLGQVMPWYSMELWTEHVNATIAQQVRFCPDRFLGACQLPQNSDASDSTHMLATLESAVRNEGFVAAYVSPDPKGQRTTPGMNAPYWFPLYERCVELDVPIIVHDLFYDTCAHDVDYLTAAIRQRGVPQMVFGSEAPGAGDAVRQEGDGPGKTGDDLVPVIDSFDWLTEEDKLNLLHHNPLRVVQGLKTVAGA